MKTFKHISSALNRAAEFMKEIALDQPVVLFANPWLSLKRIGNYVYSSETRSNGKLVAVLIYDSSKPGQYYGRFEDCPSHFDGMKLSALTGGVEKDDPMSTAVHEIKEESGFTALESELDNLGTVRSSKSSDTVVYLYAWDAKDKTPETPQGDGSDGEVGAYCEWVSEKDYAWCKDPLAATMILRFKMGIK
jgi:8-oxo-dGTP pyrophosphatase MutT (NUDIX family)